MVWWFLAPVVAAGVALIGRSNPRIQGFCSDRNSVIYTSELESPQAECLLIRDGYIAGIGSRDEIIKLREELPDVKRSVEFRLRNVIQAYIPGLVYKGNDWIRDLPAESILTPGFIDSHGHTLEYGHAQQLSLLGTKSISEITQRIEAWVDANEDLVAEGAWIEGSGWDQTLWNVKEFPSAADLDTPKLRNLPIVLFRADYHAFWVSPRILSLLPSPLPTEIPGGKIIRFPDSGLPTGVFIDDAMDMVNKIKPVSSEKQKFMYLNTTMTAALEKGVVGVHDAFGSQEHVEFFERMALEGKLKMNFYIFRVCPDTHKYCGDTLPMIDNAGGGKLNVRSVKLFADGALGSWGAALLEPYSDKPDDRGIMRTPESVWKGLIDDFIKNGWQTNIHCIGDRANHIVLDAIEAAVEKYGPADRRIRIEHTQILTQADLERAVRLGVIGSFQPTHATSDMWYAEDRLGPERLKGAYAWQTYLKLGGRIALGSDFPVESIDPLKGFFAAITRTDEQGQSPHGPGGWFPEQKLTRDQALRGFTIDGAYAAFQENVTGSFAVGKRFDAVIWDQDIMKVSPQEILRTRVLSTFVQGEEVYRNSA